MTWGIRGVDGWGDFLDPLGDADKGGGMSVVIPSLTVRIFAPGSFPFPPFLLSCRAWVTCGSGLAGPGNGPARDTFTDCVAAEFFRSEVEDDPVLPPLGATLFRCFGNRAEVGPSVVGVAEASPELVGLREGCLREEMSMVGEGRLGMGVSMVEGREMDDSFIRSSFVLVATSVGPILDTHLTQQSISGS